MASPSKSEPSSPGSDALLSPESVESWKDAEDASVEDIAGEVAEESDEPPTTEETAPAASISRRRRPPNLIQPPQWGEELPPRDLQPGSAEPLPTTPLSALSALSADNELPPPSPTYYEELVEQVEAEAVFSEEYGEEGIPLASISEDMWPPGIFAELKKAQGDAAVMDQVLNVPPLKLADPERIRERILDALQKTLDIVDKKPIDQKEEVRETFDKMATDIIDVYRAALDQAKDVRRSGIQNLNDLLDDLQMSAQREAMVKLQQRVRSEMNKEVLSEIKHLQEALDHEKGAKIRQERECKKLIKRNITLTTENAAFKKLVEQLKGQIAKTAPGPEDEVQKYADEVEHLNQLLRKSYKDFATLQNQLLDAEGTGPADTEALGTGDGGKKADENARIIQMVDDIVWAISENAVAVKGVRFLEEEEELLHNLIDEASGEKEELSLDQSLAEVQDQQSVAVLINEKEETIEKLRSQLAEYRVEREKLEATRREKQLNLLVEEEQLLTALVNKVTGEPPSSTQKRREDPLKMLKEAQQLIRALVSQVTDEPASAEGPHNERKTKPEPEDPTEREEWRRQILRDELRLLTEFIDKVVGKSPRADSAEGSPGISIRERGLKLLGEEHRMLHRLVEQVVGESTGEDDHLTDAEQLREKEAAIRSLRRELADLEVNHQLLTETSKQTDKELLELRKNYDDLRGVSYLGSVDAVLKKVSKEKEELEKRIAELEGESVRERLKHAEGENNELQMRLDDVRSRAPHEASPGVLRRLAGWLRLATTEPPASTADMALIVDFIKFLETAQEKGERTKLRLLDDIHAARETGGEAVDDDLPMEPALARKIPKLPESTEEELNALGVGQKRRLVQRIDEWQAACDALRKRLQSLLLLGQVHLKRSPAQDAQETSLGEKDNKVPLEAKGQVHPTEEIEKKDVPRLKEGTPEKASTEKKKASSEKEEVGTKNKKADTEKKVGTEKGAAKDKPHMTEPKKDETQHKPQAGEPKTTESTKAQREKDTPKTTESGKAGREKDEPKKGERTKDKAEKADLEKEGGEEEAAQSGTLKDKFKDTTKDTTATSDDTRRQRNQLSTFHDFLRAFSPWSKSESSETTSNLENDESSRSKEDESPKSQDDSTRKATTTQPSSLSEQEPQPPPLRNLSAREPRQSKGLADRPYYHQDYQDVCENCVPVFAAQSQSYGLCCCCCSCPKNSTCGGATETEGQEAGAASERPQSKDKGPSNKESGSAPIQERGEPSQQKDVLSLSDDSKKGKEKDGGARPTQNLMACGCRCACRGARAPGLFDIGAQPITGFTCLNHHQRRASPLFLQRDASGLVWQLLSFFFRLLIWQPLVAFHRTFIWSVLVFIYMLQTLDHDLRPLWDQARGNPRPPSAPDRPAIPALPERAFASLLAYSFFVVAALAYVSAREERRLWLRANGFTAEYLRDLRMHNPYPWWSPVDVDYRFARPWLVSVAGRLLPGVSSSGGMDD